MIDPKKSSVQEVEHRGTPLGLVLYIKIQRYDGKPMSWDEVHARFAYAYPDKWAVQTPARIAPY
jgi:hypothetical protein